MNVRRYTGVLRWAGRALALGGMLFLGLKLHEYWAQVPWFQVGGVEVLALAALVTCHAAAGAILALAWASLLRHLGVAAPDAWAFRVYGTSQIAKYLPGNVFHFLGRQAIATADGYAAGPVVRSAFWELAAISASGASFALLALPSVLDVPPLSAIAAFVIAVGGGLGLAHRRLGRHVARALALHTLFHAISAAIFLACLELLAPAAVVLSADRLGMLCGAYVVAWLAGIATPGAPAGMGVREVALLWLLGPVVEPAALVAATVVSRLVMIGGDLGFYLFAVSWRVRAVTA